MAQACVAISAVHIGSKMTPLLTTSQANELHVGKSYVVRWIAYGKETIKAGLAQG